MNFEKIGPEEKNGAVIRQSYKITRTNGEVTIKDVNTIKRKWLKDGEKNFKAIQIDKIKVLSGKWTTFTDEEKFNAYFESNVKDPTKYYQFEQVIFFVNWEP